MGIEMASDMFEEGELDDAEEERLEMAEGNQRCTLDEYKATLEDYDQGHVEQFRNWGKHMVTGDEREVLRFLAATYGVEGRSLHSAQRQLTFTRTLPGMANVLPKTIEQCWSAVVQVRMFCDSKCCYRLYVMLCNEMYSNVFKFNVL